jgi:photosystem II stability/assembly factor-like uncharacterized protein
MQHKILWVLQVVLVFVLAGALLLPNTTALAAQATPADHWEQVSTVPVTSLTTLTADPTNSDRLYAGGSSGTSAAAFRSDDGGLNWTNISVGLTGGKVGLIAAASTQPNTMYAATDKGIFRSTDQGAHWTNCSGSLQGKNINDIVVDSLTPAVLYAMTLSTQGALFWRSTDSGTHWTAISADVMAVDPTTPTTIYAGDQMGVLRSTDRGAHWKRLSTSGPTYVAQIVVDPVKPATIYVGTSTPPGDYSILRSDDQGSHWTRIWGQSILLHLAVDAKGDRTLYAATAAGIVRSDDNGGHWASAFTGLTAQNIWLWNMTVGTGSNATAYAWRTDDNKLFRRAAVMTPSLDVTLTLILNDKRMTVAPRDGSATTTTLDAAPLLGTGNRTLVPLRAVAEAFGVTVAWDATARTATITGGISTLKLTLGKATAIVNGLDTPIDTNTKVVPLIVAGRMLLPVRFVAESRGPLLATTRQPERSR